jgi:hypothetical protein
MPLLSDAIFFYFPPFPPGKQEENPSFFPSEGRICETAKANRANTKNLAKTIQAQKKLLTTPSL